ncbi:MAG TPA: cysteine desulfurase [Polyangiaceae bacterium]|nr:cysteine desulfurase [Polyangiaceae bacterium]
MDPIYLDHNATTPPHPRVLEAMMDVARRTWANPASVHRPGQRARAELDRCRAAVAALVGLHPRDCVLTSGGTEANNLALWQAFASGDDAARREGALLVSRIEHPSVTATAEELGRRGVEVRWLDVDPSGRVEARTVADALDRGPARLVALMAVNHETGVIQPVAEVAELARAHGAQLLVDAVQAVGRLEPSTWAGADMVTVAAHKIRGPKGIGALLTRPGIKLRPFLRGGEQERGLRPGTQDAALAAGFRVAAERAKDGAARYAALDTLRDRLEHELVVCARRAGLVVQRNGEGPRAPHVINLSWSGWQSAELCAALDLEGVALSSGSACSAGTASPSPVIMAMHGPERAASAVRISLGEDTTEADVDGAVRAFGRVLGVG